MDIKKIPTYTNKILEGHSEQDILASEWKELFLHIPEKFPTACSWVLCHLDYAITWGLLQKKDQEWDIYFPRPEEGLILHQPKLVSVQNLRLFNKEGEVFFWRTDYGFKQSKFRFRSIIDQSASDIPKQEKKDIYHTIDENWALWGTRNDKTMNNPNWWSLTEDRGMRNVLPIEPQNVDENGNNDPVVSVQVRKYIDFDPHTHLAYTRWTRLVDLVTPEGHKSFQPNTLILENENARIRIRSV